MPRLQDSIIKPSTRRFIREARRTPGYSFFDFLHGYIYARWPYLYIGIGIGEHPVAKRYKQIASWLDGIGQRGADGGKLSSKSVELDNTMKADTFAENYHGKVVPLGSARQLVTVNEPIELPDLEQVIPYKRARSIVLHNPDHIVALECPCRSARPDPCLPLDVCLIVGEPFASFVVEHHPGKARRISSREAVQILRAEDERGHAHHAFFKDAMLERFYAICNCCSCCCGAMQSHRNGTPMLCSSGYVTQVEEDLCIGCGDCAEFCQFGALSISEGCAVVDVAACMGCGVCSSTCQQGALSLQRDESKGEPLEIFELFAKVDTGISL